MQTDQVPFMIFGSVVGIVGTALLTTIKIETPTAQWATYLVLSGIGIGFGINIPYTALQVVLRSVHHSSSAPGLLKLRTVKATSILGTVCLLQSLCKSHYAKERLTHIKL